MRCEAEFCPFWTGDGCICDVMQIERPEPLPREEDTDDGVEADSL